MRLILDKDISEKLLQLAAEDNTPAEELFAQLVDEEDRRRHVIRPPFKGEVRVRCGRELCEETRRAPNSVSDDYQL